MNITQKLTKDTKMHFGKAQSSEADIKRTKALNEMDITRRFAKFMVDTDFEDIPEKSVEMAKLGLMDWIAVTLIAKNEPLANILNELDRELGGKKQSTIIGKGNMTSVLNAALINGSVSHALDYDDVNLHLVGHPTVPVVPAILALGEWKGISGKDLLTSYILGVEAEGRISLGVRSTHYFSGWHATSTIGTFGAAIGSSKILGLDLEKTVFAIGIAGTQAAGLRQVFGSMCKPFHAGKAAMNGLLAALLAEKGFTSSRLMLEGELGFSAVMASNPEPEKMLEDIGNPFVIDELIFKSHASCFETHSAVDVALGLQEKSKISIDSIEHIDVAVSDLCIEVARVTKHETGLEAKFSIPYCTAVALISGEVDMDKFSKDMITRNDYCDLAAKVSVKNNRSFSTHQATISILTKDGKRYEHEADTLEINKSFDYRRQVVEKKIKAIATSVLGQEKQKKLFDSIKEMEKIKNIKEIVSICF